MAQKIEIGTILIKEDTDLPESLHLESEPYLKGWRLVKNLSSSAMDRNSVRWDGPSSSWRGRSMRWPLVRIQRTTTRRAVAKVIANMKSGRYNCLEISRVAAKSFLGLPCVTVAGHRRHIQESIYLFRANHISEADQATVAAA